MARPKVDTEFKVEFDALMGVLRHHARKNAVIDDKLTVAALNARIKRVIPVEEVLESDHYNDMGQLATIFNNDIVEMRDGVWRWRPNTLVTLAQSGDCGMHEGEWEGAMKTRCFRGAIDLNDLWCDYHRGRFTCEELMKFNMQIGYSLSGFAELFGQKEATDMGLEGARKRTDDDDPDYYVQTPIDYMIEKYKGQVLKL
jgi:hypothetical protein